jgi:hypothetical protein
VPPFACYEGGEGHVTGTERFGISRPGGRRYVSRSRFNGPNPLTVVGAALAPPDLDPQTGLVMTRM